MAVLALQDLMIAPYLNYFNFINILLVFLGSIY